MNPLLTRAVPVPFDRIRPEHVVPAIREALAEAEQELAALVADPAPRTYAGTIGRLDDLKVRLNRVIRPAAHLAAVMNTPEMREAYDTVVPEFSAFYARLALNEGLWHAIRDFAATDRACALTGERRRHLDKTVRDFVRAGADLAPADKVRVEAIHVELSSLQTTFSNNTLDATNAFALDVVDEADLAGLPDSARQQARAAAEANGTPGWRFTLQMPSYGPFMQYSERRELRRQMYTAYMNRASGGETDNRPLVRRILELRRELAQILGFRDFADLELEDSMAGSGGRAFAFERDLAARTRPFWEAEMAALEAFARAELGLERLEPWDVAFSAERMRRARFDLDEEALRPYFPMDRVLSGLFELSRRLFGIVITEEANDAVWHPEARFYRVEDEASGTRLGAFYTDWFPRATKRGGAWMSPLFLGGPEPGGHAPHLASIAANLSPPEGNRPALLTHREVQTVFHEFGHLLHHTLSRVEVRALGGTSVPSDWVELPSQIMENWTWEREALDLFARHWETGEALPDALYDRMLRARTFMGANHQMRQLSFGTVDLDLHVDFDPATDGDPVERSRRVMAEFALRPEFADHHFVTAFTHVFSGGYAAGYYSYLWSEVLDADAFSRFQREGLFNRETGRAFVDAVLSRGDAEDPAVLFREFMGRDPDPEALLRRNLGVDGPVAA